MGKRLGIPSAVMIRGGWSDRDLTTSTWAVLPDASIASRTAITASSTDRREYTLKLAAPRRARRGRNTRRAKTRRNIAIASNAAPAFAASLPNAVTARSPSASKTIAQARKTNAIRPSFEHVHSASRTAIQEASTRSAPNLPRDTSSPKFARSDDGIQLRFERFGAQEVLHFLVVRRAHAGSTRVHTKGLLRTHLLENVCLRLLTLGSCVDRMSAIEISAPRSRFLDGLCKTQGYNVVTNGERVTVAFEPWALEQVEPFQMPCLRLDFAQVDGRLIFTRFTFEKPAR